MGSGSDFFGTASEGVNDAAQYCFQLGAWCGDYRHALSRTDNHAAGASCSLCKARRYAKRARFIIGVELWGHEFIF